MTVTQGGATVLDSDDQENNPFDLAITLELEATIEELEVRAKRELEELVTEFEEKKMALVEKSMALDELCDELEEKINMALDEELEAYVNPHVEFDGKLRSNIMKHLEVGKSELEKILRPVGMPKLEREFGELMRNITNDLDNYDKRIAGVSMKKASSSIERDNEIKLAIAATASAAAAKPGAAQEQEWMEQL
eukprot:jgi/Chrpa1/4350/Chrysochromulina_OHIO_Genome00017027-RA